MHGSDASTGIRDRAVRGTAWYALAHGSNHLINIVVLAVLARVLDDNAFGVISQSMVVVALLQLVLAGGMGEALIQRPNLDPRDTHSVFWANLALASVLTLIGVAAAPNAARLLNEPMVSPVITALLLLLPISALGIVQEAMLSREMRFRDLALRQAISNLAGGLVAVVLVLSGAGVWTLVGQQLTMRATAVAAVWFTSPWRPARLFSWSRLLGLLGFGSQTIGLRLCLFGTQRSHDALLGAKLSSDAVGQFYMPSRLVDVIAQTITLSLSRVVFPSFSRVQSDQDRVRRGYLDVLRLTGTLSIPAYCGVIALAPDIMRVVFGPSWTQSWPVLAWLSLGAIFGTLSSYNPSVFLALGRPSIPLGIQICGALSHLGAVSAVLWSAIGGGDWRVSIAWVAAAIAIRKALFWPIPLLFLKNVIGLDFRSVIGAIYGPILAAFLMALCVSGLRLGLAGVPVYSRAIVCIALGVCVYPLALTLIDRKFVGKLIGEFMRLVPLGARGRFPLSVLDRAGRLLSSEEGQP